MVKIVFAAVVGVVAADDLAWKDCGSAKAHAHIVDLAPLTLPLGQTTRMVGKGLLDSDQTSGTFSFNAKVGFISILKGGGSLCEDTTIKFPLNAGSLIVRTLGCPTKAGDIAMNIDVSPLTASQQLNDLVNIAITAVNDKSEELFCLDLTTSSAFGKQAVACSANDQAAIQKMDAKAFGDASNKCGTAALGLTGINHDKFNSCLSAAVGIGAGCSECFAVTADYGFNNCKSACLLGWCKSGCLSCTAPAQVSLPACTGIPNGSATPCMEVTV